MSNLTSVLDKPKPAAKRATPTPADKALRALANVFAGPGRKIDPYRGIMCQHTRDAWYVSDSYAAVRIEHGTPMADALAGLFADDPTGGSFIARRSGAYDATVLDFPQRPRIADLWATAAAETASPVERWVRHPSEDRAGAVAATGADKDAWYDASRLRPLVAFAGDDATFFVNGPKPGRLVRGGVIVALLMGIRDSADVRTV